MENGTFAQVIAGLIGYINLIIPLIAGAALVAFMFNVFRLVWDTQNGHLHGERKTAILWSLLALFVLFSIWGILRILLATFFPEYGAGGGGDAGGNTWYLL